MLPDTRLARPKANNAIEGMPSLATMESAIPKHSSGGRDNQARIHLSLRSLFTKEALPALLFTLLTLCVACELFTMHLYGWRCGAVLALLMSWTYGQDGIDPAPYLPSVFSNSTGVSVAIWTNDTSARNDTAPYLSGIMFEDIAHSGDGGLYAELVRNRAFQGSGVTIGSAAPLLPGQTITDAENPILPWAPTLDGWHPVGDARLSLDILHPLSDALQVALQVDIPLNATGEVGFHNDGFWGMDVSPQTYNASFWAQSNGYRWNWTITHFDVSLRDSATGQQTFASSRIDLNRDLPGPVPYEYRQYSTSIVSNVSAPNSNNGLYITMDAEELRGQTIYFDLISLFPETYKNRPNGLRKDLAEHLEAGAFRFLRFPGGNNLEGYSIARRWKWWKTIGPLTERAGRPGDWSYYNTDGLGLLEYMYWCEDMNLVPLLGVYAGFSLDLVDYDTGNSTDANEIPLRLMGPVLQEALDELEYLMGDVTTYWGNVRAEHGHPEPFDIPFIEIGNEDFFSHNYPARAEFMLNGLKAAYPNITYVYTASQQQSGDYDLTLPQSVVWDEHVYAAPSTFIDSFDKWDNWQADSSRKNVSDSEEVFASLMEYHVNGVDKIVGDPTWNFSGSRINHPRMLSAVAEAVNALGWERNPNVFKLAAFAPLIQNLNFYRNTPYLILFDADPANDLLSTSYYQEQMFNTWHGTQTLPFTILEGDFNPLFFASQIDGALNVVYFKVVNAGNTSQTLNLALDVGFSSVNGTILEAPDPEDLNAFNQFGNQTTIQPKAIVGLQETSYSSGTFNWTVPPYSVTVLQFNGLGGATVASNSTQQSWNTTHTSRRRNSQAGAGSVKERRHMADELEQDMHAMRDDA